MLFPPNLKLRKVELVMVTVYDISRENMYVLVKRKALKNLDFLSILDKRLMSTIMSIICED